MQIIDKLFYRKGTKEISKAKVAAFLLALGGLLQLVGDVIGGNMDLVTAYNAAIPLLGGLGLYGIRGAQDRN